MYYILDSTEPWENVPVLWAIACMACTSPDFSLTYNVNSIKLEYSYFTFICR